MLTHLAASEVVASAWEELPPRVGVGCEELSRRLNSKSPQQPHGVVPTDDATVHAVFSASRFNCRAPGR